MTTEGGGPPENLSMTIEPGTLEEKAMARIQQNANGGGPNAGCAVLVRD